MKGLSVIHTHHLDSGYTKKLNGVKTKMGWKTTVSPEIIDRLYDEISNENELYIITLVREPIGRNISAYFHNLDAIFRQDNVHAKLSPEQIMEGFFTRYPHSIPITWFDEEFNKVLGLDIYNHPFPKDEGALILNEGRFRILVMRHDIEDSRKQKYIEQLLDVINVKIVRKTRESTKHTMKLTRNSLTRFHFPMNTSMRCLDPGMQGISSPQTRLNISKTSGEEA